MPTITMPLIRNQYFDRTEPGIVVGAGVPDFFSPVLERGCDPETALMLLAGVAASTPSGGEADGIRDRPERNSWRCTGESISSASLRYRSSTEVQREAARLT